MKASILILLGLALTACDDGGVVDQTITQGLRQSAVEACTGYLPQSEIASAAGLDADRLCGCVADRITAGKNPADLLELRPNSPEVREAALQCVAEVQGNQGQAEAG